MTSRSWSSLLLVLLFSRSTVRHLVQMEDAAVVATSSMMMVSIGDDCPTVGGGQWQPTGEGGVGCAVWMIGSSSSSN